MVKKITLNDNTVLTNQKEILDQIRIFYAYLYENKENNLKDCNWNTLNYQPNKLTPDDALSIEKYCRNWCCFKGIKHQVLTVFR